MELMGNTDNVREGLFDNIWSKLKRKSSHLMEGETASVKKDRCESSEIGSDDKDVQTEEVPLWRFLDNISKCVSCVVCGDLPVEALQCTNGHLLCSNCHWLLLDQRRSLCPVCRVPLTDNVSRSLITEHVVQQMPLPCPKCSLSIQRSILKAHMRHLCPKREAHCKYTMFGCAWTGIESQKSMHHKECLYNDKLVDKCLLNCEKYISNLLDISGNDAGIFKSVLKQMKNESVSLKMNKVALRFISKERNEEKGHTFSFGNNLFCEGLKVKVRLSINKDFVQVHYCLAVVDKSESQKISFFLNELKANYVTYNVQDSLRSYAISGQESWTNWFSVRVSDPDRDFLVSVQSLEGQCVHVGMVLINKLPVTTVKNNNEGNQWRTLVNDVLGLQSIDHNLEQSDTILNQLGSLEDIDLGLTESRTDFVPGNFDETNLPDHESVSP